MREPLAKSTAGHLRVTEPRPEESASLLPLPLNQLLEAVVVEVRQVSGTTGPTVGSTVKVWALCCVQPEPQLELPAERSRHVSQRLAVASGQPSLGLKTNVARVCVLLTLQLVRSGSMYWLP